MLNSNSIDQRQKNLLLSFNSFSLLSVKFLNLKRIPYPLIRQYEKVVMVSHRIESQQYLVSYLHRLLGINLQFTGVLENMKASFLKLRECILSLQFYWQESKGFHFKMEVSTQLVHTERIQMTRHRLFLSKADSIRFLD